MPTTAVACCLFLTDFLLGVSSTLNMGSTRFSETSVDFYLISIYYIPSYRCKNFNHKIIIHSGI
jgi:hypothetical protein